MTSAALGDSDPARLEADQALVDELRRQQFRGKLWEDIAKDLATYGLNIMQPWISTLAIFEHCARKNMPIRPPELLVEQGPDGLTDQDIEDLVIETVGRALQRFRDNALIQGRWSPNGGASLTTFFIGQCLIQFPAVFRRWWRNSQHRWDTVSIDDPAINAIDRGGSGWPDGVVDEAAELAALCADITNERTQRAVRLRLDGYSNAEVGEILGVTTKAVEGLLYRLRKEGFARDRRRNVGEGGGEA